MTGAGRAERGSTVWGDRKPPEAGPGSALQLKDQAGRFVLAVPAERTESFSCPQRQQEPGT